MNFKRSKFLFDSDHLRFGNWCKRRADRYDKWCKKGVHFYDEMCPFIQGTLEYGIDKNRPVLTVNDSYYCWDSVVEILKKKKGIMLVNAYLDADKSDENVRDFISKYGEQE